METHTAPAPASATPAELTAMSFMEHYRNIYAPEGLLTALQAYIDTRTQAKQPVRPVAPTHLIRQYSRQKRKNRRPLREEEIRFLSTILSWQHTNTILTHPEDAPSDPPGTWLDPTLGERLPPGTTYINLPITIQNKKYLGAFITPDNLPEGRRQLTLILLGAKPVTLSLELGVTLAEAAAITVHNGDIPHAWFRRDHAVISATNALGHITNALHTFATTHNNANHVTAINIRDRALSVSQLIENVLSSNSTRTLRHAIHSMRDGANRMGDTWPANVFTPTHILRRALANPRDGRQLALAHLITSIDALHAGGQVHLAHEPLNELPNQLTSLHTLPSSLAENMSRTSTYVGSPDSLGTLNNGMIIRPDVTEQGEYSFVITFHTRSLPSVHVPLNVRVEDAITDITQQLSGMQDTELPCLPDKLRPYLFGVLTALTRFLASEAEQPDSNHVDQETQTLQIATD